MWDTCGSCVGHMSNTCWTCKTHRSACPTRVAHTQDLCQAYVGNMWDLICGTYGKDMLDKLPVHMSDVRVGQMSLIFDTKVLHAANIGLANVGHTSDMCPKNVELSGIRRTPGSEKCRCYVGVRGTIMCRTCVRYTSDICGIIMEFLVVILAVFLFV